MPDPDLIHLNFSGTKLSWLAPKQDPLFQPRSPRTEARKTDLDNQNCGTGHLRRLAVTGHKCHTSSPPARCWPPL
eukprot:6492440-Amphidinium_carterae.1